ncbi:uncharacterized protein LOC128647456 [Bombina bombina]|uniref:uncharacterized protein LOC128647456 n=1 Tax=Bombina bombina TaxID=8345 RepID=UPI00235AE178|nr:uncharacterized protein LOC128647456 [Bombina bombina]
MNPTAFNKSLGAPIYSPLEIKITIKESADKGESWLTEGERSTYGAAEGELVGNPHGAKTAYWEHSLAYNTAVHKRIDHIKPAPFTKGTSEEPETCREQSGYPMLGRKYDGILEQSDQNKANQEQECDCTLVELATGDGEAECCAPTTSHTEVSQFGNVSRKNAEEKDVNKSETNSSTAKSSKENNIVPDLDYSDPAKWPYSCSDDLRQLIIQHGPQEVVLHDFPKDSKNRRFSTVHCKRRLANGEEFVEYLALFDHIMNEHFRRVKDQETLVHYLGKDIQNELIQLLAGAIKKKIITSTTSAKYYSIILDCTPDVSHIKQMTMIVRFVDVSKPSDNESESITIREHFYRKWRLQETTGAFIAETLLEQLKLIQLPIENLRGQGYDNGSNMKGNIYDALIEIFEDTSLSGPSGNTSRVEAKGLADAVSKFKFVVSLVTWYNILFEVDLTSKLLQNKEADLNSATRQLQVTKNYLITCRCDKGFQQVLTDATEIANEIQIVPNFETEDQVRKRRKKRQFDYEAREEAPQDPKQKFKTGFYYAVLDMAIQSIEERFQQLQKYNSLFGFLYDIYSIKKK